MVKQIFTHAQRRVLPAFITAIENSRLREVGISFYKKIPQTGYSIIIATADRVPLNLLMQFDAMINEEFKDPTFKQGKTITKLVNNCRIPLFLLAIKGNYVLSICSIQLLSSRGRGMGMSKATRESVIEIGSMYTRPKYRNRGIATRLTEIRLTVGVEAIIKLAQQALAEGVNLKHKNDKMVASDLGNFRPERLVESLLGDESIVRVFFENPKQMPRVKKVAENLGYRQSKATEMFLKRQNGELIALKAKSDDEANVYLALSIPVGDTNVSSQQQISIFGQNTFERACEIVRAIAIKAGHRADVKESDDEEEQLLSFVTDDPQLVSIPEFDIPVYDFSNLNEKEASANVDELKVEGDYIVIMPKSDSIAVAWSIASRNKNGFV